MSDVIVGFLGRLFLFLNKQSMNETYTRINQLNQLQLENINLFAKLIKKSEKENKLFLHHISSINDMDKFWYLVNFIFYFN